MLSKMQEIQHNIEEAKKKEDQEKTEKTEDAVVHEEASSTIAIRH